MRLGCGPAGTFRCSPSLLDTDWIVDTSAGRRQPVALSGPAFDSADSERSMDFSDRGADRVGTGIAITYPLRILDGHGIAQAAVGGKRSALVHDLHSARVDTFSGVVDGTMVRYGRA